MKSKTFNLEEILRVGKGVCRESEITDIVDAGDGFLMGVDIFRHVHYWHKEDGKYDGYESDSRLNLHCLDTDEQEAEPEIFAFVQGGKIKNLHNAKGIDVFDFTETGLSDGLYRLTKVEPNKA